MKKCIDWISWIQLATHQLKAMPPQNMFNVSRARAGSCAIKTFLYGENYYIVKNVFTSLLDFNHLSETKLATMLGIQKKK
jgi:hypothetical protein